MFTLDLLQAVNDWQRGFNDDQKVKRIAQLTAAAGSVDQRFRESKVPCYRQVTLRPNYVWKMGESYKLNETVSSWSEQYDVAMAIKGGVAPAGMDLLPVIFCVAPERAKVVLNIAELYREPEFNAAVAAEKANIAGYWYGIGRYGDSQSEVVLELDEVLLSDVYATGGHSSSATEILERPEVKEMLDGCPPEVRATVEREIAEGRAPLGPMWLTGEPKDRIVKKWIASTLALKAKYNR
jgi:hypothetical protein